MGHDELTPEGFLEYQQVMLVEWGAATIPQIEEMDIATIRRWYDKLDAIHSARDRIRSRGW